MNDQSRWYRRSQIAFATALLCSLLAAGCQQEDGLPPPQPADVQQRDAPPPSVNAEDGATQTAPNGDLSEASFLGLRAPIPASWQEQQPQSAMHHTSFRVPGEDGGDDAQIVVFFFGAGQGGPIDANIQRWEGQFRSPEGGSVESDVQRFEVDGMPIALVELQGEYMAMGDRWYTEDQHFLAAIVDAPGDRRIFIRFVGDRATVQAHRESFLAMIDGLKR